MQKSDEGFDKRYNDGEKTESITTTTEAIDLKIEEDKYDTGKPSRIIVSAKIIDDQDKKDKKY